MISGPLYHGSRARVREGSLLSPGQHPNPWGDTFDYRGWSVFVYCTTDLVTAESYASEIRRTGRRAYVYEVEPTGEPLPDYNGSDFKTRHPLRVIRRV